MQRTAQTTWIWVGDSRWTESTGWDTSLTNVSKCEWGSLNCCERCKGRTFILVSPRLSVLEDTLLLGSSVQKHVVASRDTRHPSRQWQLGWRVWPQIQNIPCHHFKWCICWEIKIAEGGSLKRSARQGMHENDMEAERVFKGAHCRTHLPTVTASCT